MSKSFDEHLQMSLAEAVRKRRLQKGLTQESAAQAMEMSTRHFQKLEAGQLNITLRTLARVAKALDMELSELFKDVKIRE